jgi:hypothetical protein
LGNTTTYAPPASRNAPCPCGSGRRWKECHGRAAAAPQVGPDGATGGAPAGGARRAAGGAHREAIAIYDTVIASHPGLFDAWHMRGVAHFQLLAFDAAERDIRRALEIEPALDAARRNLELVIGGRLPWPTWNPLSRRVAALFRARRRPARASARRRRGGKPRVVIDAGAPAPVVDTLVRDAASGAPRS